MHRAYFIASLFLVISSACSQPQTENTPLATSFPTYDPTQVSTSTPRVVPSKTPREPRNEPTNTPITPTITPTLFDPAAVMTATSAPKAKCPNTISLEKPNLDFLRIDYDNLESVRNIEQNILDYLNKYDPAPLVTAAQDRWYNPEEHVAFQDLTNDGLPELAMGVISFSIFGCKNGHYETLLEIPPDGYLQPSRIISISDNNRNGIPEITLLTGYMSQGGHSFEVYEWDGEKLANVLPPYYANEPDAKYLWVEATGGIHYEDIDKDRMQELVLDSGIPVWSIYVDGLPWRNERTTYHWNGNSYALTHREFASPEFRFQAIQDGDLATTQEEYDKALKLYQDAIFSDQLKGYSPEIRQNLQEAWGAQFGNNPKPTPYPNAVDEYPKLAAYAYFRIMLLHLIQGHESDAGTVYKTLRQKYGNNQYSRSYVEMANSFWDTYQSTHNMADSCLAANHYAAEHPEIWIPLGSDYHGWQSHTYEPSDLCPFR